MERLSMQEEEAMMAVWSSGEASIKNFLEKFPEPRPPYTTLASTIRKLESRGFLESRLVGNTYLYRALVTEEDYKKNFMSGVVKNYFADSYKDLVNFFIRQKKLSPKELKEIIDRIEKGSEK